MTPDSAPRPVSAHFRVVTVTDVTCQWCEQGAQFESPERASRWKDEHFEDTGHDGKWFEVTHTKQIPIRSRRLKSDVANDLFRRTG
ncbi:hypothetical protein [Prauserella endophytica]|uniref:Uncharacterized protein n=1 Tax=Prauserella endophytica TaxID=1592324 RepID=A0ABY2S082_9PSEU|nr:hypothetical protein [Prauserella endophytica]TKG67035.1 hypothetical protein FCN18_24320 [Prauserella endophytica]